MKDILLGIISKFNSFKPSPYPVVVCKPRHALPNMQYTIHAMLMKMPIKQPNRPQSSVTMTN